jgi:hypothetical protein
MGNGEGEQAFQQFTGQLGRQVSRVLVQVGGDGDHRKAEQWSW